MFAQRVLKLKKAEVAESTKEKREIAHDAMYYVSSRCKQNIDFDCLCLKCGACGRKFNEKGELI